MLYVWDSHKWWAVHELLNDCMPVVGNVSWIIPNVVQASRLKKSLSEASVI